MREWYILAVLCMAGRNVDAGGSQCRAQNILDSCLKMQQLQFKSCEYDDWECKCHGQKKVLTCYDNCPESENRTLQEMQVQVFCAALSGNGFNTEMIDRMTRAARIVADDQPPPTHAPANSAPAPQAPAPKPTSASEDDSWNRGKKGANGRDKDNSGFSVINDDAAASMHTANHAVLAAVVVAIVLATVFG
ncbi:hypothetical protein H4R24_001943 [Coemansia sp. RSA 988]|nr:hypothetical protein H4R24_001943 [Coemansia sp. RSA 988]